MADENPLENPEVKQLWQITAIIQVAIGFTNGLYLYTYGPYFYEKFGGDFNASTAMLFTTVLLGVRQGMVALLEVPTGALADAIGRVHVVIVSWITRVLFFAALAILWLCHTLSATALWGIFASIAYAVAYTTFNGAFSAWCVERLREISPNTSYGWLSSRFYSYQQFAICLGGITAVLFYINNLAALGFLLAAVISFVAMGYAMHAMQEVQSLHFLPSHQVQWATITKRVGEIIGRGMQVCSKTPVLFWIIMAFGSYMFLLSVVLYLWPVYLKAQFGSAHHLGRNWIAIIVAAQTLSFLSARLLVRLNARWHRGTAAAYMHGVRRMFTAATVVSALAVISLAWGTSQHISHLYFFPTAVMLVILAYGVVPSCFETLITLYISPDDAPHRATIMSAGSMLRSVLILLLAIPSGGESGATSPIGWAIPATLLLFSATIANHYMRKISKHPVVIEGPTPSSETPES